MYNEKHKVKIFIRNVKYYKRDNSPINIPIPKNGEFSNERNHVYVGSQIYLKEYGYFPQSPLANIYEKEEINKRIKNGNLYNNRDPETIPFIHELGLLLYNWWLYYAKDNSQSEASRELSRLLNILKEEKELYLYCWCAPEDCHAEAIAEELINLLD